MANNNRRGISYIWHNFGKTDAKIPISSLATYAQFVKAHQEFQLLEKRKFLMLQQFVLRGTYPPPEDADWLMLRAAKMLGLDILGFYFERCMFLKMKAKDAFTFLVRAAKYNAGLLKFMILRYLVQENRRATNRPGRLPLQNYDHLWNEYQQELREPSSEEMYRQFMDVMLDLSVTDPFDLILKFARRVLPECSSIPASSAASNVEHVEPLSAPSQLPDGHTSSTDSPVNERIDLDEQLQNYRHKKFNSSLSKVRPPFKSTHCTLEGCFSPIEVRPIADIQKLPGPLSQITDSNICTVGQTHEMRNHAASFESVHMRVNKFGRLVPCHPPEQASNGALPLLLQTDNSQTSDSSKAGQQRSHTHPIIPSYGGFEGFNGQAVPASLNDNPFTISVSSPPGPSDEVGVQCNQQTSVSCAAQTRKINLLFNLQNMTSSNRGRYLEPHLIDTASTDFQRTSIPIGPDFPTNCLLNPVSDHNSSSQDTYSRYHPYLNGSAHGYKNGGGDPHHVPPAACSTSRPFDSYEHVTSSASTTANLSEPPNSNGYQTQPHASTRSAAKLYKLPSFSETFSSSSKTFSGTFGNMYGTEMYYTDTADNYTDTADLLSSSESDQESSSESA